MADAVMRGNVICVDPARPDGGTLARCLRRAGYKVWCVPDVHAKVSSPEFDRPDAVLLEQSVTDSLVQLAHSLWPNAVVVRFDEAEPDDGVLERLEAALKSGHA